MRQCEHCDNPDKAKWTQRCLYKGPYPSGRAFILPCAMDAYDDRVEERRRRRRRNRPWFWAFWLILAALAALPLAMVIW